MSDEDPYSSSSLADALYGAIQGVKLNIQDGFRKGVALSIYFPLLTFAKPTLDRILVEGNLNLNKWEVQPDTEPSNKLSYKEWFSKYSSQPGIIYYSIVGGIEGAIIGAALLKAMDEKPNYFSDHPLLFLIPVCTYFLSACYEQGRKDILDEKKRFEDEQKLLVGTLEEGIPNEGNLKGSIGKEGNRETNGGRPRLRLIKPDKDMDA